LISFIYKTIIIIIIYIFDFKKLNFKVIQEYKNSKLIIIYIFL